MAIIGIDLGTTNSLVAHWHNHACELIPNSFNEYLTPSVISVDDEGTILVGKAAKERLITHPDCTVASFKRFMGTDKTFTLGEHEFTPEDLSAFVIRKLVEDAKAYLNEEIEEVIISVPAYFDDNQRWATKTAGKLAGVHVERLINEPSAAALASHMIDKEEKTFLIIDFGGGTLDISVVDAFENIIEIVAVSGDNHLGGDDFNEIIMEAFLKENNIDKAELSNDILARIAKQAEFVKWQLSKENEVMMSVIINEEEKSLKLTNETLITLASPLLKRMEKPILKALKDSSYDLDQINNIIMVGGTCKMPVVQEFVHFITKFDVQLHMEPDKAIAIGCGTAAGIKSRNVDIKDTLLTDICPFTLGVAINPNRNNELIMSPIIERNTILPCSRESTYVTLYNNQKIINFEIYQGEHMLVKNNLYLGEIEIPVPRNKAGHESAVVRLTYDINGILEVDVRAESTNKKAHTIIVSKSNRMSEADIKMHLKTMEKLKLHPRDKDINIELIERGNRLFMELTKEARDIVLREITNFKKAIESQDEKRIKNAYIHTNEVLSSFEHDDKIENYFKV